MRGLIESSESGDDDRCDHELTDSSESEVGEEEVETEDYEEEDYEGLFTELLRQLAASSPPCVSSSTEETIIF